MYRGESRLGRVISEILVLCQIIFLVSYYEIYLVLKAMKQTVSEMVAEINEKYELMYSYKMLGLVGMFFILVLIIA